MSAGVAETIPHSLLSEYIEAQGGLDRVALYCCIGQAVTDALASEHVDTPAVSHALVRLNQISEEILDIEEPSVVRLQSWKDQTDFQLKNNLHLVYRGNLEK